MDIQRITDALRERFFHDDHRLVFWHDPDYGDPDYGDRLR